MAIMMILWENCKFLKTSSEMELSLRDFIMKIIIFFIFFCQVELPLENR